MSEIAELKEELQRLTERLQVLERKPAAVPSGQVVPLDVCDVVLEASEKPVQSLGAYSEPFSGHLEELNGYLDT